VVCDIQKNFTYFYTYQTILALIPIWAVRAGCRINWLIEIEQATGFSELYHRTSGWQTNESKHGSSLVCGHSNGSNVVLTDMPEKWDDSTVEELQSITIRLLNPDPVHLDSYVKQIVFGKQSKSDHLPVLSAWVRSIDDPRAAASMLYAMGNSSFLGGFQPGVHGYSNRELDLVYKALSNGDKRDPSRLVEAFNWSVSKNLQLISLLVSFLILLCLYM
jgi:hypothetical protein